MRILALVLPMAAVLLKCLRGATTPDSVAARRISLVDGVVGPIVDSHRYNCGATMKRLLLCLLAVVAGACGSTEPGCNDTPGPFGFASSAGSQLSCAALPTPGPGIISGFPERRAGYGGELWWLPFAADGWLLNGETVLTSEFVTTNASAVRVPTGPRFGYDHSVSSGERSFAVGYIDGVVPENLVVEEDLLLTAQPVFADPVSGEPTVSWAAATTAGTALPLWEGDVEPRLDNAQLVYMNPVSRPNDYNNPIQSFGGVTQASTVSARLVHLDHGVLGPISTVSTTIR
jgi:hypothetical protein